MYQYITLTRANDGAKVYVNTDNICAIYPQYDKDFTLIAFIGSEKNVLAVKESVDSIRNLIRLDTDDK